MHNRRAQVSMLFDIRISPDSALTGPLSIGCARQTEEPVDSSNWEFAFPHFVIDRNRNGSGGHMYTLELDLEKIAHSWDHANIQMVVPFLLQRNSNEAKKLILSTVRDMVSHGPLRHVSRAFNQLNRVMYDNNVYRQTNNLAVKTMDSRSMMGSRSTKSPSYTKRDGHADGNGSGGGGGGGGGGTGEKEKAASSAKAVTSPTPSPLPTVKIDNEGGLLSSISAAALAEFDKAVDSKHLPSPLPSPSSSRGGLSPTSTLSTLSLSRTDDEKRGNGDGVGGSGSGGVGA